MQKTADSRGGGCVPHTSNSPSIRKLPLYTNGQSFQKRGEKLMRGKEKSSNEDVQYPKLGLAKVSIMNSRKIRRLTKSSYFKWKEQSGIFVHVTQRADHLKSCIEDGHKLTVIFFILLIL